MTSYFLKKILYALATLFGVVSVVFFLFHILPGDPARMMLDQNQSAEQIQLVNQKFGFDKPITTQYFLYLNDLSPVSIHSTNPKDYSFNKGQYKALDLIEFKNHKILIKLPYLRESFQKSGKPVSQILAQTLPSTILLAVIAISIALILGVLLGVLSAVFCNTWIDKTIALISTFGMSVPSFFSAILFAWIFGFVLHKYTGLSMSGSLYEVDDYGTGQYISLKNCILPSIVLGIRPLGVVSQLMRNSLLEVFNQDYITTAKAKGLPTHRILRDHCIKNALNPVITALSGWFASMLAGAVFVEYIFGWNGLGKEIVEALNTLDLPVIMGAVLVIATSFILITILVDLIYVYLDPRVKLD